MPRKREEKPANFYAAFPERLREIMQEHATTQQELAEYVGKSRQAIGYYADGSSSPDWKTVVSLARYFGVSTDWLLGATDVQSTNIDIQQICKYLGLSEQAIAFLHTESFDTDAISSFDKILRTNYKLFHRLNIILFKAFQIRDKHPYSRIRKPFGDTLPSDVKQLFFEHLDEWGGELLDPQEAADHYLSEASCVFRNLIDAASHNMEYISLSDI
ncbi:MAG: helix-turn-helix transcriptional regulator [Oscillibacter sp.]|nr:helix-turn-helix transcriptional regulator [Oscillibacter sp.]